MKNLTNTINNFDLDFRNSDDSRTYNKCANQEAEIKRDIENLTKEQLEELKENLNEKALGYFFPVVVVKTFNVGDIVRDTVFNTTLEVISVGNLIGVKQSNGRKTKEHPQYLELIEAPKKKGFDYMEAINKFQNTLTLRQNLIIVNN